MLGSLNRQSDDSYVISCHYGPVFGKNEVVIFSGTYAPHGAKSPYGVLPNEIFGMGSGGGSVLRKQNAQSYKIPNKLRNTY